MSFLHHLIVATGVSLAICPAFASDNEPAIHADQPLREYVPAQSVSQWYIRGDIGYNFAIRSKGGFSYSRFDPLTAVYSRDSIDSDSHDGGIGGGIGLGYSFTDYFRMDATVDVLRISFNGTTASPLPCISAPALMGTGCRTENAAQATAYSIMANAYADLGTFAGFTPYIGVGLGVTHVDWSRLDSNAFCTGASCSPDGAFLQASQHDGASSWRLAWAVMAGVAYDITPRLKADLGYRFRDIAGGDMFGFERIAQASGATGMQGSDHGLRSHEVRIGLRYALW